MRKFFYMSKEVNSIIFDDDLKQKFRHSILYQSNKGTWSRVIKLRNFFRDGGYTPGKIIQSINISGSEFYFKHLSTGKTIVWSRTYFFIFEQKIFDYRLNFMKGFNDKEHHETYFANIRNLISPSNIAYETIISKKIIQGWKPES